MATRDYLAIIDEIVAAGVGRNISLKLTQLGLDSRSRDGARQLAPHPRSRRRRDGFFVRIDMENSPYTEVTLDVFETLWGLGYRNLGVVLQSALHRTEADLTRVLALGARVRLVKGAYKEPASVAYQRKAGCGRGVSAADGNAPAIGHVPALATHDPEIIDRAKPFVAHAGIAKDRFEFQMLYGVRRDLQASLARAKATACACTSRSGGQWFPYFMRRLGRTPRQASACRPQPLPREL